MIGGNNNKFDDDDEAVVVSMNILSLMTLKASSEVLAILLVKVVM